MSTIVIVKDYQSNRAYCASDLKISGMPGAIVKKFRVIPADEGSSILVAWAGRAALAQFIWSDALDITTELNAEQYVQGFGESYRRFCDESRMYDANHAYLNEILIVTQARTYMIDATGIPFEIAGRIFAIGSGAQAAYGAAFALDGILPSSAIAEIAVSAAARVDPDTGSTISLTEILCTN